MAAKPDTIPRWFRKRLGKFDGSRQSVVRPRVEKTIEDLIVRMGQENPWWGYDRIVEVLANLGLSVFDQTAGTVRHRHGIAPATTAQAYDALARLPSRPHRGAGRTDFFRVEVLIKRLLTYYVLFFIQLEPRRVCLAWMTPYPDQQWMEQQARKRITEGIGVFWHTVATWKPT